MANILLGLTMIYSWVHFGIIQHKSNYADRSSYERVVTWVAIGTFALIVLSVMAGK